MPSRPEYPSFRENIFYETFFTGAIGGSVVALLFLVLDAIAGRALFTPSVAGSAIFFGVPPALHDSADLEAVALFTALHFLMSGGMGLAAALLVRAVEPDRNHPLLATLLLFVVIEGGFLLGTSILYPSMPAVLGHVRVALVNLIAASAMVGWVHHAHHVEEQARTDAIRGPSSRASSHTNV